MQYYQYFDRSSPYLRALVLGSTPLAFSVIAESILGRLGIDSDCCDYYPYIVYGGSALLSGLVAKFVFKWTTEMALVTTMIGGGVLITYHQMWGKIF
jgi:hypothetical protein